MPTLTWKDTQILPIPVQHENEQHSPQAPGPEEEQIAENGNDVPNDEFRILKTLMK